MDISSFIPTNETFRLTATTSLIVAMIWYLDFYFFNQTFFNSAPYYIPIVLAVCLGFLWTLLISLISICTNRIRGTSHSIANVSFLIAPISMVGLSLLQLNFQLPLKCFILTSMYIGLAFLAYYLIKWFRKSFKEIRKETAGGKPK